MNLLKFVPASKGVIGGKIADVSCNDDDDETSGEEKKRGRVGSSLWQNRGRVIAVRRCRLQKPASVVTSAPASSLLGDDPRLRVCG